MWLGRAYSGAVGELVRVRLDRLLRGRVKVRVKVRVRDRIRISISISISIRVT